MASTETCPPAEPPPVMIRWGSMPSSLECDFIQRIARLGVGDADALACFARRELFRFFLVQHAILSGGSDEAPTGQVLASSAELPQSSAAPTSAVKQNHAGHFGLGRIVIRREINFQLARRPAECL